MLKLCGISIIKSLYIFKYIPNIKTKFYNISNTNPFPNTPDITTMVTYIIENFITFTLPIPFQYPYQTNITFTLPIPILLQHIRQLILCFPTLYNN